MFGEGLSITDGAWGTELHKLGLKPGESCERLNLEAPEMVVQVARSYVEAGSNVILTNSFQANPFVLERHGLADRAFEINKQAVELSRRAAGERARVFASMGPSGKMILSDEVTADQLIAGFVEQVKGLVAGRPDAIILETFADLDEWKLAARAVKDVTDLPVIGCFTFDSGPDKSRTMMGVSVTDAVAAAEELGLAGVGANCGLGVENYLPIARAYRDATTLAVWIKPNAGLPRQEGDRVVYQQTAEEFAQHAMKIAELKINFLGGCCGTTPAHIAAMNRSLSH